ncbi:glycosyltransferase [Daejeonia sp. YH14]|uniref:glycosyltransferase n=1 Tax=Daejeonia sp. YH14 TaxID=3439042 RepID=UPI003F495AC3
MKLAVIINSLNIGGAEKLVADGFPLMVRNGIQSELVVLKNSSSFLTQQLLQKNIHPLFLTAKSVYNPFLIFKLMKVLKRNDVVHFHLFPTLYWVVFASLFLRKKPYLIYTEHNTHNKRRDSKVFKPLDRFVYSRIDRIVTIADEVEQNLVTYLGNPIRSKIESVPNGVDLSSIEQAKPYTKKDLGLTENDIAILQVSSFRWQKDHPTLLKAMKLLPDRYKLLLAGDGMLKTEIEKLAQHLQVYDRVQFLGNRSDISRLLKSVDIIVLSSNHEGLSLSSIEAMASGKPFIASDVPGLHEMVNNYGLLFEKGNDKELAEIILKLETDTALREEVIQSCLNRAKDFDLSKMVEKYSRIYQNMYKPTLHH